MKPLAAYLRVGSVFAAALAVTACSAAPAPPRDFAVELTVHSDDGSAVADVTLARGRQSLGKTDAEGRLRLRLAGAEGEVVPLAVTCPDRFVPPGVALSVRLTTTRRVGKSQPQAQKIEATCARRTRDVVVIVHAPGGETLPVKVNGLDAGTTDVRGDAQVVLRVERDLKALDVELDTTARPQLLPANPRKLVALDARDGILLVEQPFSLRRAGAPASRPRAQRRHVPTRID